MDSILIIIISIVILLVYIVITMFIKAVVAHREVESLLKAGEDHLKRLDAFYATPWDDKDNQKDLDQWKKKSL